MPVTTGYAVASITALKALPTTDLIDGYGRSVTSKKTWYFYYSGATDTADNDLIVTPDSTTGRWFSSKIISTDAIRNLQIASDAAIAQSKISGLVTDLAGKAPTIHNHVPADVTNLDEYIQDLLNTTLIPGSGISINYNDIANTLTITSAGSGSTGFLAATLSYTSPTLAPGSSFIGSVTSDILFTVLKCSTTYPARVRVYSTNAFATTDSSRLITNLPVGNHGCQLDVVTTTVYQTLELVPPVQIYTTETPSKIYISVINLDNTNRAIPVLLNIYKW